MTEKTTLSAQEAMDHFQRISESRKFQMMKPVQSFLQSWANEKQPVSVYAKGCAILEEADNYTPEQVVHRIVLETVRAWAERSEPSGKAG